ncbi:unannotated protein [freshwater metagenome]|uniref:Unannotated protein n=1 Tax=freshwater metagenome TaxID=449393 RepID=A0A6J7SEC2_9ZZZZ
MGLMRVAARTAVISGTATAVSGRVAQRQAHAYDEKAAAQQGAGAPEQSDAPPADDAMAKIAQLAELHKQGILTDEEFAAAKAKALGI